MEESRVYTLNEEYFKNIDTPSKAYFLGLLYADGTIQNNKSYKITIALQERDKYILESLKKELDTIQPILFIKKNNILHQDITSLTICSKKLVTHIIKLGCIPNKTKTLTFPDETILPKQFISHFIRGVFDGDGSVWEGKRKIMNVVDKTKKTGRRDRVIHNVKFNITGTPVLMESIQDILVNNLEFKKNKINRSKKLSHSAQLEYSGRLQMKKFYEYLYKDAELFLIRKKDKFNSIINYGT